MAEDDDGGDDGEEDEGGKPGPQHPTPAHMLPMHQHQSTQGHHVPTERMKKLKKFGERMSTWCFHHTA